MAAYLAQRIELGKLNYKLITESPTYSKFKSDIDEILLADGYTVNEDGTVTKKL